MVSSSPVISSLSCRERASGAESGVGIKERREWRRRGRKMRMMAGGQNRVLKIGWINCFPH